MYQSLGALDDQSTTAGWSAPVVGPDPEVLKIGTSLLARIAAPAISLVVFAVAIVGLARFNLSSVRAMLPTGPAFWLLFAVSYAIPPLADWIIFRRLWKIPLPGFFALVRKLIGNELLFGYVGEVYFYSWARKRTTMTGAPFGAVKDVAILSAVVGNCVTLAMLAVAYPMLGEPDLGVERRTFVFSIAVVLVTSLGAMLFRRRLFSLPRAELNFVVIIHFARIAATTLLAAWMWHVALPTVEAGTWLLLATVRLLLSRLPFVPNKDIVFAGIVMFIVGHNPQVVELMTLMAALIFATHLVLGVTLATVELVDTKRQA